MNEEARNFYELERLWSDLDELADTEQAADSLSNQEAEG
jgi:ribosomal silencing factor RsfS